MKPAKDADWRAAESRRMIADARALVSMAESLAEHDRLRGAPDVDVLRTATPGSTGAVLIHAVSLRGLDVASLAASDSAAALPILVLLDDAPAVPAFLPEGAHVDLAHPTEEGLRSAIERHVRGALGHSPSQHHILDLVESIRDSVIVIDRERTVAYLNPCATALLQTLTGRTGPFVGEPLGTAFPPSLSAPVRPAIEDALVHADESRIEDPTRHHGIALDIAIFPHPQGATLLMRDATQRWNIEAELIDTRLSLARAEARLRARGDEAPA